MKKLFTSFLITLVAVCGNAQELKPINATVDDYLSLLKDVGYNVFSYDISSLKDSVSTVAFSVREYVNGVEVDNEYMGKAIFKTVIKISDFDEEQQRDIKESKTADDEADDVYRFAKKMKVGFTPVNNDTIQNIMFELSGTETMGVLNKMLFLRDNRIDKSHRPVGYSVRPFVIDGFENGKFIPLLIYGSFWYDAEYDVYRFCGENELPSDMKSDIMKLSPHYFVMGVEFR